MMANNATTQWEDQSVYPFWNEALYQENHTPGFKDPNIHFRITYILLYPVTLLIFVFNIPVLISVALNKKMHVPTFYFVTSLGVADILVGITCLGKIIVPDEQTYALCLIRFFFLIMPTSASIFNIFWIAVDRYLAIESPLHYNQKMTPLRALAAILGTWIYAIVVGLIILWWNLGKEDERCSFLYVVHPGYVWFLFMASMVIPTTANIVIYGRIFLVTRKHIRRISAIEGTVLKNERLASSLANNNTQSHVQHLRDIHHVQKAKAMGSEYPTKIDRLFECKGHLWRTNEPNIEADMANEVGNKRNDKDINQKQDGLPKQQISNNTHLEGEDSLMLYSVTCAEGSVVGASSTNKSQLKNNSSQGALLNQRLQRNNSDSSSPDIVESTNINTPSLGCVHEQDPNSIITFKEGIMGQGLINNKDHHHKNRCERLGRLSIPGEEEKEAACNYRSTNLFNTRATSSNGLVPTRPLPSNQCTRNIHTHQSPSFARTLKAVKKLGVILGCFLLTWGPFAIVCVAQVICGYEKCDLRDIAGSYLLLLGFCNSFLNPLVYALWNKHFRDIAKAKAKSIYPKMVHCCLDCCDGTSSTRTQVITLTRQVSLVPVATVGQT